jgi:rubredoxin
MFQGNTKLKISPTTAFSQIDEEANAPKIQVLERKTAFARIKSLFHSIPIKASSTCSHTDGKNATPHLYRNHEPSHRG